MCTVKGSVGCTPRGSAGVPGSLPLLRGRRGTMCVAKGLDVRPGVLVASLGLRLFYMAGVGQCALPRGWMYAPGFRWHPWVSASFAWRAWDNVHCQGVGCTHRGSAEVPGSPPLLRGRRGTMCTVKGSDVRPGVPLASLGLRLFCVAGVGQCALSRGRMYAPGFRWRPWVSVLCVAGVGQCALPRGWMYAPGFRWRPWVSASFAWQAWGNVHYQGVGWPPWGCAGVPGSPPLLRCRRGTMCTVKGSDVRPGVPLASLGLRLFCVAGVGQCALPRGWMYALGFRWRPWVSASFAWQAWDNVHCQGVGCTPRGSAGVPRSPPLLRGRRGAMCIVKGSDVRPGVPLASLGLRLFCVAGVGQCALPRGWMYVPGFRWRPWVSASFAWQAWGNVRCQGVGCTPWSSAGVPGSPPLLRGRRGPPPHSPHLTSLMHSLTHSLPQSLTHSTHSHIPHSHHSLTLSFTHLYTHIHTHTHKLIHHHPSITLILPLPFLIFYAQSKSREVGNMWGYLVL